MDPVQTPSKDIPWPAPRSFYHPGHLCVVSLYCVSLCLFMCLCLYVLEDIAGGLLCFYVLESLKKCHSYVTQLLQHNLLPSHFFLPSNMKSSFYPNKVEWVINHSTFNHYTCLKKLPIHSLFPLLSVHELSVSFVFWLCM